VASVGKRAASGLGRLVYYNTERPHRGYRNRGKRPMDTINDYLTTVRQEG
jgi:hypothetical protein